MKKVLLTSAGFDNKKIADKFLELINKPVEEIKILFITAAAVEVDAIMVLPSCIEDLTKVCGIKVDNIDVYDMHKLINEEEINKYDGIYMCGGSSEYLVERIDEIGFKDLLYKYLDNGGVYVGVSAGSTCGCGRYETGLNFIKNKLQVHQERGSNNGPILNDGEIFLTNNQAILITDEVVEIFE